MFSPCGRSLALTSSYVIHSYTRVYLSGGGASPMVWERGSHHIEKKHSISLPPSGLGPRVSYYCLLIICSNVFVFLAMLTMCVLYVSLGSSAIPSIVGVCSCAVLCCICRCRLVIYYLCGGVNSAQVVLSGLIMMLLSFVHVYNGCICVCMYALAGFLIVCVDGMVM